MDKHTIIDVDKPEIVKRTPSRHHLAPIGLRTVALFEFAKGLLVLLAGLGLLSLIGQDVQAAAEELVVRLHLNAARHYPRIFIEAAANLTDARLWFLSAAAAIYAAVRFVETYGLWHERPWAEWFAVISAGLYLPVEMYHFFHHHNFASAAVFLTNAAIVAYLGYLLAANHQKRKRQENAGG